ncbi:MAG TPA: DUF4097 family beta strand repeat-containing protein [Longimicrobiales bacterium]|nr:DUF4097 family beta strand repeat-containing protein [Longimicrobiales bacterium]
MRRVFLLLTALVAGSSAPSPAAASPHGSDPVTGAPPSSQVVRDSVIRARPGDRLVLQGLSGHVVVRGGEGDEVRVSPSSSGGGGVGVVRSGDRLRITGQGPRGRLREGRLELEVPAWLPVEMQGRRLGARVEGLRSEVSVRNVEGDIEVRDVEGDVRLWTVEGEIRISDVRGRISARSMDETVDMVRVGGEVEVGSTDGDLRLVDVDATRVTAETVDGDITFDGRIRPGGTYSLITHDGDLDVSVPEDADARVSVSTFDGSFEAGFPITLERFRGGREMTFTLGAGSAELTLQAFDGEIFLGHRRSR